VAHDLLTLVEVPEHDHALAESLLGRADALMQLVLVGIAVLEGDLALARCAGGDDVAHGGPRAVPGAGVEVPGADREIGGAGGFGGGARDDRLQGVVDRGIDSGGEEGCGHRAPPYSHFDTYCASHRLCRYDQKCNARCAV